MSKLRKTKKGVQMLFPMTKNTIQHIVCNTLICPPSLPVLSITLGYLKA